MIYVNPIPENNKIIAPIIITIDATLNIDLEPKEIFFQIYIPDIKT